MGTVASSSVRRYVQCMCSVLAYSLRFGTDQPLPTPPHHTQTLPKGPSRANRGIGLSRMSRFATETGHPTSILRGPANHQLLKFDAALCGQAKATKRKVTKATWRISGRFKLIPPDSCQGSCSLR